MNLIEEQHLAGGQRRQNRRQVPGMLNRGAGGDAQGRVHLGRNNHGQGGLTQAGRARKQHVIGAAAAHLRGLQHEGKLLAHAALTHEVVQGLGAQGRLNHLLFGLFFHRDQALRGRTRDAGHLTGEIPAGNRGCRGLRIVGILGHKILLSWSE